jgi:acetyl-CoA synthetase
MGSAVRQVVFRRGDELSYNCLDRHLTTPRRNKAALIWESEPGEVRTLTYQQLHDEVCRFANVLKSIGVSTGERVAIYMGMCPALPIAMLACARIGAPHTVVFGGFSATALADRINDCQAACVITQDGALRRGQELKLKPVVDEALKACPTVRRWWCTSAPAARRRWSRGATCGGTS